MPATQTAIDQLSGLLVAAPASMAGIEENANGIGES
jgi:hypothetical protein